MAEEETIFSSNMKYKGILSFKDYYKFCYDWLVEELSLTVIEKKYKEKLKGDAKDIEIKWVCEKEITDYFKFRMKVDFMIINLKEIEVTKGNVKEKTNHGEAKLIVKGILVRDYDGKFERSAFRKFLRGIYEKWVITSRVKQFEEDVIGDTDKFLQHAKGYLDLEGRR